MSQPKSDPRGRPFVALVLLVAVFAGPAIHAQDKRADEALSSWLAQWQKGQLDLTKPRITKSAVGVRAGYVSPEKVGETTHQEELTAICDAVVKADSAQAADALLEVCAAGLDPGMKYVLEQRPDAVRRVGEFAIDRLHGKEAVAQIETVAKEAAKSGRAAARRAAALRALGRRHEDGFFATLEAALGDKETVVRLAACEAAQVAGIKELIRGLATLLRSESDAGVTAAAIDAMHAILLQHKTAVAEDRLKAGVDAAVATLGKGDWRSDLAAVEFLEIARSAQSVPALIEVLARQMPATGKEDAHATGLRSGELRQRAFEVLVSLSGARFPMEDADAWRRWWDKARENFAVAEIAEKKVDGDATSTGGTFFGIPVRGSRVLFIVDTSGSMLEDMRAGTTTSKDLAGKPKIDAAKHELLQVVDKLTPDCAFNLVWFSNGAESWSKDMVEATPANKKKFAKVVEGLRADGSTNLWEALQQGLKLESFAHGARYNVRYDEIFILSDGIPTNGAIKDPKELLSILRDSNRYSRITINTIYIAGDPESERKAAQFAGMSGADFMRKIAEDNGGRNVTL